jgi:8-oxo-dGTP pyrophosphatase MutT (NUDIX family)
MNLRKLQEWKVTKSEHVLKDRWISVRAEDCITSDGRELAPYYVLEYPDWTGCFILSDDGEVTLLNHYRHGARDTVLELVAGSTDGEDPDVTVVRELEEEAGLIGAEIHKVGEFYANPANQTNKVHAYIALGGTFEGKTLDEVGAEFEIIRMPLKEFLDIIENQAATFQGLHLAIVYQALNFLKKQGKLHS